MSKNLLLRWFTLLWMLMSFLLGTAGCSTQIQSPEKQNEEIPVSEEDTISLKEEIPEALPISVMQIEAERVSRQQIQISWTPPLEGEVETYLVKRRLASAQTEEWSTVATVSANQVLQVTDQLADTSIQQYVYTVDILPKDPLRYRAQAGAQVLASNLLICLDPGHYLGANRVEGEASYGYDEGDATLQIARVLRRELKWKYGIETCMTRTDDSIALEGYTNQILDHAHLELRGKYAGETGSDLFLSLHTNANQDNANGYETCLQPISINKPILLANTVASTEPTVIAVANAIGTEIAKESYHAGTATVATFQTVVQGKLGFWSDFYNDSPDIQGSVYYRVGQDGRDYYGVLRGAAAVGVPGLIIEHGMHTVPEVRKTAMEGDLLCRWACADARGIANGFGFVEKDR